MKPIITFLSLAVLSAGLASGQYFHHVYGRNNHDLLKTGENASYAGPGHLMSGIQRTNSPITGLIVVRTNGDGNVVGATKFQNSYRLIDPLTGDRMRAVAAQVKEVSPTVKWGQPFYAVTGSCLRSSGQVNAFYLELSQTGNVIPGSAMLLGATNSASTRTTASALSASGEELYLCGSARVGANTMTAVMKLDLTSAPVGVMWSRQYLSYRGGSPEAMIPTSLIESPYENTVVVVGSSRSQSGQRDGFVMRLKAPNGNAGQIQVHGTNTTNESFSKISVMDNTALGQPGFVLAGTIQHAGHTLAWLTFTDEEGYGVASRRLSTPIGTGSTYLTGTDVIERQNVAGDFEYYLAGTARGSSVERFQMAVNKVTLGSFFHQQYRYGAAGREVGVAIDFENTMAGGLSIYGTTHGSYPGIARTNFYCVKSYFNGVSGCHEFFNSYQHGNGPGYLGDFYVRQDQEYLPLLIPASVEFNLDDQEICFGNTLAGGDNN